MLHFYFQNASTKSWPDPTKRRIVTMTFKTEHPTSYFILPTAENAFSKHSPE